MANSRADRIRALHKRGRTIRQIVETIYGEFTKGRASYVRVVTRQRIGGHLSDHDEVYIMKTYGGKNLREAFRRKNAHYRARAEALA